LRSQKSAMNLQFKLEPTTEDRNAFERLSRLYDIVGSLNSIIRLDQLLDHIVSSAADMMEANGGALMLVDAKGHNLTFEVASGSSSEQLKGIVIPIDERSIAGLVAQRGVPYIENDAEHSPYFSGQ